MDVIFTIVSRNYAAQAATLMQALSLHEPAARRVVIATDGPIPELDGLAEVIAAETLDAPFAAMTVYYDALELNTAVKPYAFRKLLGEAETVTYLDPDIDVFRPLDPVRDALKSADLALTPHTTRPLLGEAQPNDQAILKSGVWNLGFAAMRRSPQTQALVDWWAEKCRFDCRVDFANGLFTDQRWMDLAPALVERFSALRDPGLNVAYWNLEGRTITGSSGGWLIDGRPLIFFHFSGFDPGRGEVLSKYQDRVRVRKDSPLRSLFWDYGEALGRNGYDRTSRLPYGHARFPSGREITKAQRLQALAAARAGEDFSEGLSARTEARLSGGDGVRRDPDPKAERPEGPLLDWLRGADAKGRPRALTALLAARADLRERFAGDDAGLLAWALGVEAPAGRFAPDLLPDAFMATIAGDPMLPAQAARFARPDGTALEHRLAAAFGLPERGRWPQALWRPLRDPLSAQTPGMPRPFPQVFQEIWQARTDLQKLFPLRTFVQRFRFLRWLAGGGLAHYDVPLSTLPDHPVLALARASVGAAATAEPPRGDAAELWVVGDSMEAREIAADRLVYDAAAGRFLGPAGDAAPPGRMGLVRFLGSPVLAAVDAMALHAKGVRWDREEIVGA